MHHNAQIFDVIRMAVPIQTKMPEMGENLKFDIHTLTKNFLIDVTVILINLNDFIVTC